MVQLFSDIKDKGVTPPRWDEHPFKDENLRTCAYICPVKDARNLNLVFPCCDLQEYYKSVVSIAFFYRHIKLLDSKANIFYSKVSCKNTQLYLLHYLTRQYHNRTLFPRIQQYRFSQIRITSV